MTWTYGGDPSANNRDNVRFMVGDTNTADQQLTDEEIAAVLSSQTNVTLAAAQCAEAIAAKLAREVTTANTGGLRVELSRLWDHYVALARRLRDRADEAAQPTIVVGGRVVSESDALDEDEDLIQPSFRIGQDDYDRHRDDDYDTLWSR